MDGHPTQASTKENVMNGKKSEIFRDNAETCADKAETAKDGPARKSFKRMEVAWLALADQQDWLDGETASFGLPPRGQPSGSESTWSREQDVRSMRASIGSGSSQPAMGNAIKNA